ncbi:hypothetical protein JZO86_09225 [Enterococcus ureasiticus]|uniref:hypothetical protein n=1 Tax=Enterococcus TaxID=1350 RepID=UPI001A8F8AE6|nr:hypothetical protein [Enterococcus ureasiticus]MBO0473880.1 hypothetical protein [Enterococcus ureasiticus]
MKSYTEKATGIDRDAVRVITREQVIVFYDFIDQRLLIDNGFIDTYWIDVAIYLIEILDENTISYSLVVAGIESEEVIKAIFQNCYQDAEINIIDYENGWLKRAEKSRLL